MKFFLRAISVSSLITCLVFAAMLSFAQTPAVNWSVAFDGEKSFIENKGQFDGRNMLPGTEILYAVDNGAMQIYFTKQGVTYRLDKKEKNPFRRKGDRTKPKLVRTSEWVHFTWEGVASESELIGEGMMQDYHVYSFLTADKSPAVVSHGVL